MNLNNKKCVPCEGGLDPIPLVQLDKYINSVSGWKLTNDGKEIVKAYKFKTFKQTLAFVNQVGEIAEKENHHPDIEFGWGYCRIRLSTHAIGGLHENDFITATKIDGINNA